MLVWSFADRLVELRAMGKTMVEISVITGYARTYCSTLLKKLSDEPERLEVLPRGGRPKGSKRALSAKDERAAQNRICGKFPDQLQLPFALWTRAAVRELIRVRFGVTVSAWWESAASRCRRQTCRSGR
jgi:hypothetical protein